ncbi:nucleoside triphosphate pyrophosphatase [Halioxenophilus sp. WMMB6]|uniref:Maf family protein n=1 Tax=Halioxenophilus sp. WMMB6 TaxID=3073815 RepID=UPI00295EF4A0|nr:nucleoside triphosphate pyrophosphatase [Halioxenophilus sp. WMMB6]
MKLVLASTSSYRAELLARFNLPFQQLASQIEEQVIPGETPIDRARRLSLEKAQAVADQLAEPALVIGSDQVAFLGDQILHKPGDLTRAREQLRRCSGQEVSFATGCCLLNSQTKDNHASVDLVKVKFKTLTPQQIEHYLQVDEPYDCAGSFKAEQLGIALFDYIKSEDPTALIGLPLISLARHLTAFGYNPLNSAGLSPSATIT